VRPAGPRSHPPAKPGGRGHARHRKPSARCSATRPSAITGVIGVVLADRVPHDFQHLGGACRADGNERIVGRVQQVPAGLLGVRGSLRGKAIAPLSECRRHSAYRMGGSCPAVAPSCSPLPGQPMPGHRPPNVWLLGLTISQQEKMPGDSRTAIRLRLRARSPAFRSAQPLSHGECACCACRSGRSARMRARVLPGPGPRLALAPTAPLDTRHHERHEHDGYDQADEDPGLRLPVTLG
jgi:hypothetical protein